MFRLFLLSAALLVIATAAQAHTGGGATQGLAQGFAHPFGGIDHLLAMVAIGLFAARLGGRALWLVPSAFLGAMIAGGALGAAGVPYPCVETGIVLSVLVLGLAVAGGIRLPVVAAMALAGFFALFHGHAHGAEMPEAVSGLGYGLGFVFATAALQAGGIGAYVLVGRMREACGGRVLRLTGSAMALIGGAILIGYL